MNQYVQMRKYVIEGEYSPFADIIEASTPCGIGVGFNDASVKIQK